MNNFIRTHNGNFESEQTGPDDSKRWKQHFSTGYLQIIEIANDVNESILLWIVTIGKASIGLNLSWWESIKKE